MAGGTAACLNYQNGCLQLRSEAILRYISMSPGNLGRSAQQAASAEPWFVCLAG